VILTRASASFIDVQRYGNTGVKSGLCGKQVKIINPANKKASSRVPVPELLTNGMVSIQSVTVVIADACPTCNNGNSIDLSQGAFDQIAQPEQGEVPSTSYLTVVIEHEPNYPSFLSQSNGPLSNLVTFRLCTRFLSIFLSCILPIVSRIDMLLLMRGQPRDVGLMSGTIALNMRLTTLVGGRPPM
jgi:hypothetical protein